MGQTVTEVVLSVGSNDETRADRVRCAIEWLCGILTSAVASHIYPTMPVRGAKGSYVNAVVRGFTMDLPTLETQLKQYEIANGRDASARAAGRVPIDIDVVIAGGHVLRPRDFGCDFFRIGLDAIQKHKP